MPYPKFFILTATLDRADRLSQAITSAKAQSYPHWELFVLDDGSSDDTPAVLARESKDERVHGYRFAQPRGVNAARNQLLDEILGRDEAGFLVILDDDDLLAPQALENFAAEIARRPDARWLVAGCQDQYGRSLTRLTDTKPVCFLRDHKFGNRLKGEMTHAIDLSLIGDSRHTERFRNSEEWFFFGDLAHRSRITPLDFVATTMELLPDGLSRSKPNRGRALEVYELKFERWAPILRRRHRAQLLAKIARHRLRARDCAGAARALRSAAAEWPLDLRIYIVAARLSAALLHNALRPMRNVPARIRTDR